MIDYEKIISPVVSALPPSGIRKFFDIVAEMDDAISLGVGEPDFTTPWAIREAGIYSLEKGQTHYTANAGLMELREEICNYYDRKFDMEYLGWCMTMGATWMLGESKLRQLIVPNPSALGTLCFVMIMLVPIPVLFYVDLIQQGRYKKPYFYLGCAAFGNFLICLVLHLTGTADFIETLPGAHVILAVTFFLVFLTFCLDMRKKEYRKNKLVLRF